MADSFFTSIRGHVDRAGITLSALCLVHCLATLVLVSALGIGGSLLQNPLIHEVGLAVAMIVAAVAIGLGALRHRRPVPFVTAMTGLSFMGGALAMPHGSEEAVLTIIGVAMVSAGHILNIRANRAAGRLSEAQCALSGRHGHPPHRHR